MKLVIRGTILFADKYYLQNRLGCILDSFIKMRCLFVNPDYPPPLIGGSLVYYYYLHTTFAADELVVLTESQTGAEVFDKGRNYPIIRKKYIRPGTPHGTYIHKAIDLARIFITSRRLILTRNIDIIHIGQFYPSAFIGWLLSIVTGRIFILTVMGEDLGGIRTAGIVRRKLVLMALKRAAMVLTISKFTQKMLIAYGVTPERIAILTPGVDLEKCAKGEIKEPAFFVGIKRKRILLTVGRLTERKGQDMVLRSLPSIIKDFPDVHYIIAGAGLDEARLKSIVLELDLNNYVTIAPNLANNEIAYLYKNCQLFIMPNRELENGDTEGFGIVFLEAGWWRKPVIGGNNGGVPDAIDDGITGLLVDGNNPSSVAAAAKYIFSNSSLADKMGNAGRAKAINNNWVEASNKFRDMLKALSV